jgi:hypothetical protein
MFWPGEQPLRKHAVVNWMSDSCDTIQILLFQKSELLLRTMAS